MSGRGLTAGEIEIAETVFAGAIDYCRVRIFPRRFFVFQPSRTVMAPDGNIWYPPGHPCYAADIAALDLRARSLLLHELTHVWQHQHGVNVLLCGIWQRRYAYLPMDRTCDFRRLGIEQQGEVVRDYYLLLNGAGRVGLPDIDVYRTVLPFVPEQGEVA